MFANGAAGEAACFDDELHIFHAADAARRSGSAHRATRSSPTCAARARRARCSGATARCTGRRRSARRCYGAGLSINRVLRLTADDYAERETQRILPRPRGQRGALLGIHTINRAGDLTVVDAFTRQRRI